MNKMYLGLLWASVGYLVDFVVLGWDPVVSTVAGSVAAGSLLAWSWFRGQSVESPAPC